MNLRRFDDATAFLAAVESTLLENEAENALILGVALRVRDGHSYGDERPFFASVEDDGRTDVVAVRTPPHNLLVREETGSSEGLRLIASHLAGARVHLPGVHGPRSSADRFARAWTDAAGVRSEIGMEQRLYRLTEVTAPTGVPGRFRLAESKDRDLLVEWIGAFVEEAVGSPHADPGVMVDRLMAAESLAVWDIGRPVSMAGSGRPTPSGISINLVYTPPEERGNGYASACVAALSRRHLRGGKLYCTLFTDLSNRTSNALYQRIGYRPLDDFIEIRFSSKTD